MPTAENVFPKIGNDPLYASEVNRFERSGFLRAGSFPAFPAGGGSSFTLISGADLVGSVISLHIYGRALNLGSNLNIQFSGTTLGNQTVGVGSGTDPSNGVNYNFLIVFGSPSSAFSYFKVNPESSSTSNTSEAASKIARFGTELSDVHPGSPFEIKFLGSGTTISNFFIQHFERGYNLP